MRIRNMSTRMTTQKLRSSKRRAGVPARSSSLLSRLGKTAGGSRLSALGAVNSKSAMLQKSNYAKLEKSADALAEAAAKLMNKTEESGELTGEAQKLVDSFNDTLKLLKQSTGVLNQYYRQSLKEISTGNQDSLEEIGITVSADGSLSLDRKKLEAADGEKVKKLFGADGDFAKRAAFLASRVSDNAAASEQSISGRYNSGGDYVNSYLSRYNLRG